MKKIAFALIALVLTAAFAACLACTGKPSEPAPTEGAASPDLTAADIYSAANAVSGFGTMTAVPKADLSDIYGIDASKVADYAWYVSENPSLNADEIAVFKLADASYANELKGICEARIARQLSVAETYSPDEAGKLQNASVTVAGSFVYYCVGSASDAMTNAIAELVK